MKIALGLGLRPCETDVWDRPVSVLRATNDCHLGSPSSMLAWYRYMRGSLYMWSVV